ncbi:4697_t:CDS:2 [Ambispora leptoticha]|uniref:4697_t:CDS:1 n=1 Tax=Ambispora leptoticha TaxID=144679 RepID=A0A9N9CGX3_9GLOM|nr:4697_t:CDS:2 [Ambispora leptoticha]
MTSSSGIKRWPMSEIGADVACMPTQRNRATELRTVSASTIHRKGLLLNLCDELSELKQGLENIDNEYKTFTWH